MHFMRFAFPRTFSPIIPDHPRMHQERFTVANTRTVELAGSAVGSP